VKAGFEKKGNFLLEPAEFAGKRGGADRPFKEDGERAAVSEGGCSRARCRQGKKRTAGVKRESKRARWRYGDRESARVRGKDESEKPGGAKNPARRGGQRAWKSHMLRRGKIERKDWS